MPFEIFVQVGLKVKVTLEGQMIKGSKLSLSVQCLLYLCMDVKIIWHSCSFETIVQVILSRSHFKVKHSNGHWLV